MKVYKITVTVCLVLALICGITYFVRQKTNLKHDARSNTECKTNQRIFDYHDVLTDDEENNLLDLIEEYEDAAGMDIVIVTLDNKTDFSYIEGETGTINRNIQYFTEMFTDYYMFGWEKWEPVTGRTYKYEAGTSVVIAANWDTGDAWMCTSGRALERIDDDEASDIVQAGCEYLRDDPEKGFEIMLDDTYKAMKGSSSAALSHASSVMSVAGIFAALLITIIFFAVNYSKKAAKKTTNASTYVRSGNAKLLDRRDIFMNKHVTSVRINTNSGGGGGGGGSHSGGGHHGGGGGHF